MINTFNFLKSIQKIQINKVNIKFEFEKEVFNKTNLDKEYIEKKPNKEIRVVMRIQNKRFYKEKRGQSLLYISMLF